MIVFDLAQWKREREAALRRDIKNEEIAEGAGISKDTVSRLLQDKVTRLDLNTLDGLCRYAGVQSGQPVPFLIYVEEQSK